MCTLTSTQVVDTDTEGGAVRQILPLLNNRQNDGRFRFHLGGNYCYYNVKKKKKSLLLALLGKTCLNRPVFWTGTGPQSAWRADKNEREKRRSNDTTVSDTFSHSGTYLCGEDSLTISPSLYHADTFSLGVLHSVLTATRSQLYKRLITRSTGNSRTHGAVTAAIEMTARAAVRHKHGKIRASQRQERERERERESERESERKRTGKPRAVHGKREREERRLAEGPGE